MISRFDTWLTTQPESAEDTINCPDRDCDAKGMIVDALAWVETSRRRVPVSGCDGLSATGVIEGWVAGCGENIQHDAHEEYDDEITVIGSCPFCATVITRTIV